MTTEYHDDLSKDTKDTIWARIRKRNNAWPLQALDLYRLTNFQTTEEIEYVLATQFST
jgi:hypothetical protein